MKLTHIAYSIPLFEQRTNIGQSIITINRMQRGVAVSIRGEITGSVEANYLKYEPNMLAVESSAVDRGYGPTLYDILLEVTGSDGKWVVADRHSISDTAYNIWKFYYLNRDDVEKKELEPGSWYMGRYARPYLEKMTEDKSTWPDKREPIWSLWHAYRKNEPTIINKLRKKIQLK